MAESSPLRFTSKLTVEGDRIDRLAKKAYGDSNYVKYITDDNPHLVLRVQLPPGVPVYYRILENPTTGELMPPWFAESAGAETLGETEGVSVPVVEGPPVPLGFAQGYPKVEGNKIIFAINKSASYPYSVETTTGNVVAQSPSYPFASGFPVSTGEIVDGGYYVVKVGNITSSPLTVVGSGQALAFIQAPQITKVGSSWQNKYSINKTGSYATKLTLLNTNSVVFNQQVNYTSGFVVTQAIAAAGNYRLEIGSLIYNFTITDASESTEVPAWLTDAGYRYDVNSHDFTLVLGATANVEVNVTAAVGANPSGKDQDLNTWDAGTYNPGASTYVNAPYTERFSFNPPSAANGGLTPNTQYRFRIRRTAEPGDVFVLMFTTPQATTPAGDPQEIDLGTPSSACPIRPTIDTILQADLDNVTFTVLGQGYSSLKWRVKDSGGNIVRSGIQLVFDSNGNAVFTPPNQITVNFFPLSDGDYTFEIEGGNCTSTPHSAPFEVTDGVTPGVNDLEVAAYYDDSGTDDFKIRINGAKPYAVSVTNDTDDEIFAATGIMSDEIAVPNATMAALGSSGITIHAQDDDAVEGTLVFSAVDLHLKTFMHCGFSVANGNTVNHKEAINEGETMGFTTTGVIMAEIETDAAFLAYESSVNDHTTMTASANDIDNVFKLAFSKTNNKHVRFGILLARNDNRLNNGSSRTLFYGLQDCMLRPDGVTPVLKVSTGVVANGIVGSPSSTNFRNFSKRYVNAAIKHNLPAILDGTIAFAGPVINASGEMEYAFGWQGPNGEDEGASPGDFHPECVAKFKQRFPQYTGLTNYEIAAADRNGSPLALAWAEHLALEYADYEKAIWDYVYQQNPALLGLGGRRKLAQIDCGSFVDTLSPRRRSQNFKRRFHPCTFLIKSNDNSNYGSSRMDYIIDHGTSAAKYVSGMFMAEPSPPGDMDFDNPESRAYIVAELQKLEAAGGHVSYVDNNDTADVTYVHNTSGITPGVLSKAKNDFTISGPNKIITRLYRNVSDIFKTGGFDGWETAWGAFKTANSLTRVDTLSLDDLVAEGTDPGPGPDPDPDPEPGTGVYTPVVSHYGFAELLSLSVSGVAGSTSENWLITASTNMVPDSDKEFWWFVDDNLIKQGGVLTNYPYQSNEPFVVMFMIIKIGADTAYRWTDPGTTQYIPGFSDPNLGQTGAGNTSGQAVFIGFQEV